jgi:predicted Zn-ribbon and HTH transcriptional regulator
MRILMHSPDCDSRCLGPELEPSTKPCNCHVAEITELRQLVADLARDERIFIPGCWKCNHCQFELTRTRINVYTGEFGTTAADREDPEPCPNDGQLMRRISWQERLIEVSNRPIDVVLHCPHCKLQHIDAPEPDAGWTNPPHREHLCHGCRKLWRPAVVYTNGVAGGW